MNRAEAITNALAVLGDDLTAHAHGDDADLRELAALTAQAIRIHAFERGIIAEDGRVTHYLYRHHRNAATAARETELKGRARGFLADLGIGGAPLIVRVLERASGPEWERAAPHERTGYPRPIHAAVSVLKGSRQPGVLLDVSSDLSPTDEAFVLAHEARHIWHALAVPEYRRAEFRDERSAEIDADRWAEQAVLRRGWPVPEWARRDLARYGQ